MLSIKKITYRKKTAHKGDSGRVLAIGGSENYVGAVALAGIAALRAGCDVVTVAAPEKVAWAVNCLYADLITKKLSGKHIQKKHLLQLEPLIERSDVLLVGNGMGVHAETREFCSALMKKYPEKLKVIDADAIKMLRLQDISNAIITPHAREFEMLLENSGVVRDEAKDYVGSNVILLKGWIDQIISGDKVTKVKGGNPGMSKAGTGDVLAGLCAGFLAQSRQIFESAEAAAHINKKIGELLLTKKKGYSFIASDMVEEISRQND
ncbi:MAG TPA: NAD(P)H-hydrate dehydratase [Candidatus Nanoarchaeia archaeon]|nr:NAD(P)H-hydrate dehydratase [Candidatus Nanoarchaeia archaeon]